MDVAAEVVVPERREEVVVAAHAYLGHRLP
jgi:hypothetical protein